MIDFVGTPQNTSEDPRNESGLIQMIRMGKSIRHKWVNCTLVHRASL